MHYQDLGIDIMGWGIGAVNTTLAEFSHTTHA